MAIRFALAPGLIALVSLNAPPAIAEAPAETMVVVEAGPEAAGACSGRLLLFARKADPTIREPVTSVDGFHFSETSKHNFATGREVTGLAIGRRLRFHGDDPASPVPIDRLPEGEYWLQALLDRDHSYAYSGRGGGDVVSEVVRVTLPPRGPAPILTLSRTLPARSMWEYPSGDRMFKPEEEARSTPASSRSPSPARP